MASGFDYPFCEDVGKYEKLMKVGQGTFGEVFKARHRKTKQMVALKKILMDNEKEGFPITALREIRILQLLNHENIVNLIEICRTKETYQQNKNRPIFYLVFEFCAHDLAGLLNNNYIKFSLGEIKKIMQMLLNALYFLHFNKILHRDMKAANILITKDGILKLSDFGLARAIHLNNVHKMRYTNRVVTLWYRPPELLLGERNYGPAIDMWGAGLIMVELWRKKPLIPGSTEQEELNLISQLCGSITPEVWPSVVNLEYYSKMNLPQNCKRCVKEKLSFLRNPLALDLVDNLLVLNPSQRMDADTALNHDFFWSDPMPVDLGMSLSKITTSMFELFTVRRAGGTAGAVGKPMAETHGRLTHNANGAIFDRVF